MKTFNPTSLNREDINDVKEVTGNRTDRDRNLWGMTKVNLPNGIAIHIRNDNGYGDEEGINTESSTTVYLEDSKNNVAVRLASISQTEFYGDHNELIQECTIHSPDGKKYESGDYSSIINYIDSNTKIEENK
jgi:dUTPase